MNQSSGDKEMITASVRANTIGSANALMTKPIVMKMDSSRQGLVPENESWENLRANIVGNTDNR